MEINKTISICIAMLLLASVLFVSLNTVESESILFVTGSGTENDPYQIEDIDDLQNMTADLNAHYILVNHIDASETENWNDGLGFLPIGDSENRFRGSFDGQGYSINGLHINRPENNYIGLIGYLGRNATIKNVNLEYVDITGHDFVGALVGGNYQSNITDSHIIGSVEGNSNVGGLSGWSTGIIEGSSSSGDVSGLERVGGLVGYNQMADSHISNSYSTAFVSATNNESGGLVGTNRGTVVDSDAEGDVTGNNYVGGLIGLNRGTVTNSIASGEINGNDYAGGLVGWSTLTIRNSYALGSVYGNIGVGGLVGINTGTIDTAYAVGTVNGVSGVAGLIGFNNGTVSDSYAEGDVSGDRRVGGLVGVNTDIIRRSYATGFVDGNETVGGLLGRNTRSYSYVEDSYATGDVDGQNNVSGLVGKNEGTVFNSYSEGNVTGYINVGGLVGINRNQVIDSSATGIVSGHNYTGGLVGWNRHNIEGSYATGNVSGISDVGGLAGVNDGRVYSSYSTGDVNATHYVGGLVAWNRDILYNSYSTGNVSGDDYTGGLVGWNNNTIDKSYSTGIVIGDNYTGGLSGVNRGNISNSYAISNTTGVNYVGGLVGFNNLGSVSKSYSIGTVDGSGDVGGLVGNNSGIVDSTFWDNQTSSQSESAGGTGKNTEEMKDEATFTDLSTVGLDDPWDFVGNPNDDEGDQNIWLIDDSQQINEGYPFLVTGEVNVVIEPSEDQTLTASETIIFNASAYIGEVLVTDENTDFTWQNTDENGLFDTTTAGEYEVTAIYQNVTSDAVTITVEPDEVELVEIEPSENQTITAGETLEFNARAYDEHENLITDENTDFIWENTDENGLFNTTTAGGYEVTATYQDVVSNAVMVTVEPDEVDLVEIEPSEDQTITAGETLEFNARAYDGYGNLITDEHTDFTWQNTDENGLFDITTAGEYEVTATYQGSTSSIVTIIIESDLMGPEFEFSNLRTSPEKPIVGEETEFMIDVTNVGDSTGERNVSFYINGELIGSDTVEVGAGETVTASVTYVIDEEGDYELEVEGSSITVTVSESRRVNYWWLLIPIIVVIAVLIYLLYIKQGKNTKRKPQSIEDESDIHKNDDKTYGELEVD